MKVLIKIRRGLRGRYWWRMVSEHGTVAVGPAPGQATYAEAYEQALSVINAVPEQAVQTDEHRHWWAFWR